MILTALGEEHPYATLVEVAVERNVQQIQLVTTARHQLPVLHFYTQSRVRKPIAEIDADPREHQQLVVFCGGVHILNGGYTATVLPAIVSTPVCRRSARR